MIVRRRRPGRILIAAALFAVALPTTTAAASTQASLSPKQLPTWAHGSVTGAGPHNGVRLELVAWPKGKFRVGQTLHLRIVGKATSGSSGVYSIKPTVKLPGGLHNLEVLARSSSAVGAFNFARTVAGRALVAVDGSASTKPVTANIRMLALPKSALPAVPHPALPVCGLTSRKIKDFGNRLVEVGGLYSLMPDGKMQETYSVGSETTLGVGVSVDLADDAGSFGEEGTFTASSSGQEKFPAVVGKNLNEQTAYDYGEYNVCGLMHQVQPESWETGMHTVNAKPPSIDKCGINMGRGGTITRDTGTAGTFKAGVDLGKVIGISLSAQSGYNKDVSITYTAPREGAYLCGSNNAPPVAAWDILSPCDKNGNCVSSLPTSFGAWSRSLRASHLAGRTRRSR